MRVCLKESIVCEKCGMSGHMTQISKMRVNGNKPRAIASTSTQVKPNQGNSVEEEIMRLVFPG